MCTTIVHVLFLTLFFIQLECEVYPDRPKIKTSNGDLILEPAFDKNIYFQVNGPKSSIFVGGINLLNVSIQADNDHATKESIDDDNTSNVHDLLQRIQNLEHQQNEPLNASRELGYLSRRVNRLNRRVLALEARTRSRTLDECGSNPCQNSGTCLNLVNGYHCLCPSNWEGQNCEVDVNECRNFAGTDLGCQNGATCINRPGTYECLCRSGWFGIHCTRKAKDCSGGDYEMCGHGSCIAVTTGDGIKCICDQGWTTNGTGAACLTDINECESNQGPRCSVNPKVDCVNLPGSFRCGKCPSGYEGDGYVCSDIDECITIPNGGCSTTPMVSCHNIIGSRICGACPQGYQGDGITCTWRGSCSIDHGGCHPIAQCLDVTAMGGAMTQCVCPAGMVGDGIGIHGCYVPAADTVRCESSTCGSHGLCHQLRLGYTCICKDGYSGAHCDQLLDLCSTNPCRNGGTCTPDAASTRGYQCECSAQYSGESCEIVSKTCGVVLDADEGSIMYPLSNSTVYSHNSRCAWVIHTAIDKVINVTFNKFNLEDSPGCLYDFLQIHDGRNSASHLIGRFCGVEFPKGGNIISTHNNLYFWFRSDQSVAKSGFALHWTSVTPTCGGEVNATVHGNIASPGSPGKYPANRDCYWHLTTTLGKRIQLHFYALDIESHVNCSFDYIAIYDGEHTTDPILNKYCNSTQPAPIQSAGSDILIHFHSDSFGSGYGFQITYSPVDGVPGCGGYFTQSKGEILSPLFDGKYMNNLLCDYKIKTRPDTKIRLNFHSFKLEHSNRCQYDYLKIYDGPSSDARLVGRFCGQSHPKLYISSSNNLFMVFKSDHSLTSGGFKISYESICRMEISGNSGIIKSPGYPFSYPSNVFCEYIIQSTPGTAIQLTFQDFDVEDNFNSHCQYDNIEIRDGLDVNSTLLGKYCGGSDHIPPVQTSTHNYLYLRFTSDLSVSGTGFYANFTTVDTECGGILRENTGTINHPSSDDGSSTYGKNQSCTWLLIAPEGMHIQITWNRFDVERSLFYYDYVEIIEIDNDNNQTSLGKYCGKSIPTAFTSFTNRLMIKFKSDDSIETLGFSLSYEFLNDKTHCGGSYARTHGTIFSPGWPKPYDPDRDCAWIIKVPNGQQIKLNISQFDLERPIRNKCDLGDYLVLRNGQTENSPLIATYCGSFRYRTVVSISNSIFIGFHSDFYLSGNGFKIEWDSTATGCGGTLTSPSGSISSPNYPEKYQENAECFYKITTSPGSRLKITFEELDLERSTKCDDDFVEIFDGPDDNARSIGKFCEMVPVLRNIETSTNYAFVKFRSDFFIGGKGFLLNYVTVCQNNLTGSFGVIESPGYPGNYERNLNCLWIINVPKGNRINVTITNLKIPSYHPFYLNRTGFRFTDVCGNHYLKFNDSTNENKLCGYEQPATISSKSNSMPIIFSTGTSYITRLGFRLEWVRYGCGGHIIAKNTGTISLGRLQSSEEIECEWIIESALGSKIAVTLNKIYMMETDNCTTDAIEFYNGDNIQAPLLTKICHRGTPIIISSSNFLTVRFVKRSSLRDVLFNADFNTYGKGCGGKIEALSGYVYSQNYPKNYDNNLDCIWTIIVPENHRIELNLIDFDLYKTDEDSSCGDKIKIYESGYLYHANYSRILCPDTNISPIVSRNNKLSLQFISDSSDTAKGFKAYFTVTCGAIITATHEGLLSSDKFKRHTNKSCTWTIIANELNKKISLTLTRISIPKNHDIVSNKNCQSSFLRLYDGDDVNSPLIDEYCGRKVPPMIVSHGNALTVELGTYGDKVDGQFSAHYTPISSACGGNFISEEGTIASPNYPQSYPVSADCQWTISSSPGNRVYITFEQLDLEYSDGCNEDYLEVREKDGAGKLFGVYCGNTIPMNITSGTKLFLKFHSSNQNTRQGFLLNYGLLHGNEIIGLDSGEVASPLYPFAFERSGEFSWRVITNGSNPISIIVDRLEIHTHGSSCYNSLTIYDGYNEDAPVLKDFCGYLDETSVLVTESNVFYLTLKLDESNSGALFHISWAKTNENLETIDDLAKLSCGFNTTQEILPGHTLKFNSPNYPNNYNYDSKCEWILSTATGNHLSLRFITLDLEETPNCFADFISIYSANVPSQWKALNEHICLSSFKENETNSNSKFMKITFQSDSSITRKGFEAQVKSLCGGLYTDLSGTLGPTWIDFQTSQRTLKCVWTVKVRPGHVIKLKFENFNISNSLDHCNIFVTLRNGDSSDAPLLSSGKYCGYSHENRSDIETSSNTLFVSYTNNYKYSKEIKSFKLQYEEVNYECGSTSKLDSDKAWELISSPNYPSVPIPYSECVWTFSGPPGEILRVDFISRFDLDKTIDCSTEFVEIRDGMSEISPLKGRFCGEKPGTIKTSSNIVYIKYFTQLNEPRNGFQANVSVDVCGGTIIGSSGQVSSPGYPHMQRLPAGTVCEWRLVGTPRLVFTLNLQEISLPDSESSCETKLTIEESTTPFNKSSWSSKQPINSIISTFCNDESDLLLSPIESSSNEVLIKLHIGRPSLWSSQPLGTFKGFLLSYKSVRSICGGSLSIPEGFLLSPGYPREAKTRYCYWTITVPDKSRRVRLDVLDPPLSVLSENHIIGMFNDKNYQSPIHFTGNGNNSQNYVESSSNTLTMYVWLRPVTRYRFKAGFSSIEPALCGGTLSGNIGELVAPDLSRTYYCEWHYNNDEIFNNTLPNFSTLNVNVIINSTKKNCRSSDPTLKLIFKIGKGIIIQRIFCSSKSVLRIPASVMDVQAYTNSIKYFDFHLNWKKQSCGGIIEVGDAAVDILDSLHTHNETLDCAWHLIVPIGNKIEIKLEGSFNLSCDDEFIDVKQTFQRSLVFGHYCKNSEQINPIQTSFRNVLIEYHSNAKNNSDLKLMVKTSNYPCGGVLTDRIFASPNYPKSYIENQQCSWDIKTTIGNRISLQFIERFAIEDRPNCTKDVVIVYDWVDDNYVEIARLCGRTMPKMINSTHNRMKVVLRTDSEINLDGFKAKWIPICGALLKAKEEEQFLSFPHYPYSFLTSMYTSMDCTYEIYAGQNVKVKFLDLDLLGPYPECDKDNVTITDKSNTLLGIYCGKELPPEVNNKRNVIIHFKTSNTIRRRSYRISYSTYSCGGLITTPSVIKPVQSIDDVNCTWLIEGPKNKIVVLKLQSIDVIGTENCDYDSISVYDGATIDIDKRLALLCGSIKLSNVFRSSSNRMMLQYVKVIGAPVDFGFEAVTYFSYSESVGCGGHVNLTMLTPSRVLTSPFINGSVVYENFLDCHWRIHAPNGYTIKIEFSSFHIASCLNVNQTAIGVSNCDCDSVDVVDGINPNSLIIGTYCGHNMPPSLVSSSNKMSVRLYTDGEIASSGFEAVVSLQRSTCGQTSYTVTRDILRVQSPGYSSGKIPRGLHCQYSFDAESSYTPIHLRVTNFDLQSPSRQNSECDNDKFIITKKIMNSASIGKDFVVNHLSNFVWASSYINTASLPTSFTLCGQRKPIDYYLYGSFTLNLITSPESDASYKGVEVEVMLLGFCGHNSTGTQGRIQSAYQYAGEFNSSHRDCYTLITAPENHTIAAYFIAVTPDYWHSDVYLDIFDGNNTSAPRLNRIHTEYDDQLPIFSTGRYVLLHNHISGDGLLTYDLNFLTTDKGRGCGGQYHNVQGRVTSPLYPEVYRNKGSCEWELETPPNTFLRLNFPVFDLGRACDQNYLQLVDRKGDVISTYCLEMPADYTSKDNFVKIVFVTSMNNGGSGWVADFYTVT